MLIRLSLIALLPLVLGHGQVHNFITSTTTYPAADAYAAADPSSPIRKLNTYGPVPDFTTADITCGPGGNTPVTAHAQVAAGETVTFDWGSWTSVHPGPVMTYIAACPSGGCSTFKGDTGTVWVKVDQDQYNPGRTAYQWGEEIIRIANPSKYSVTIPNDLKSGQYILRHEILGLHVAFDVMGAQFYPNCVQVNVTGGGSQSLPTGIALPGSYDPYDTNGILIQLYTITPQQCNYTAPGGPVLVPFGTGDWGVAEFGAGACSMASSTGTASGSSSAASATPTGAVVQKYGQCGGQGYTGSTYCAAGSTCTYSSAYYSQCL